jgi:hypothetical protein
MPLRTTHPRDGPAPGRGAEGDAAARQVVDLVETMTERFCWTCVVCRSHQPWRAFFYRHGRERWWRRHRRCVRCAAQGPPLEPELATEELRFY